MSKTRFCSVLLWAGILCLGIPIAASAAGGIAVLDYPAAFVLHPLMSNFCFEKNCFEKAPVQGGSRAYDAWLAQANAAIAKNRETHKQSLAQARREVERLNREILRVQSGHRETIQSLSRKFDALRTSKKAEDKALLKKVGYGRPIQDYEEKITGQLSSLKDRLKAAQEALAAEEAQVVAPRYTTPAETRQMFARIEKEILQYAQDVMRKKGCTMLLNKAGMGWPAPPTLLSSMDPEVLAHQSDVAMEMYKGFLHGNPAPEQQDAPNEDYRKKIFNRQIQAKVAQIRKSLQARSGLRLAEPDLMPRVLIGGEPITVDTVNSILYWYKVSDDHRSMIVQALREMGSPCNIRGGA